MYGVLIHLIVGIKRSSLFLWGGCTNLGYTVSMNNIGAPKLLNKFWGISKLLFCFIF